MLASYLYIWACCNRQYHGLAVCDRTRRNTGSPSVGDIVGTIVVRFQERGERANGKDVSVFVKDWHLDDWFLAKLQGKDAAKLENSTLDGK